jgi:serine protease Do
MRPTRVLAVGAAAIAMASPLGAQTPRASRPEIVGPDRGSFVFSGRDDTPRAALGISTGSTGTLRDTLGLLVNSVVRGGPAEKAGLEEGNRLASINGVNLRANAADIDDYESAGTLSRRLVRELEKVKPGDEVELRVYREGRTQNMKVRTVSSDSLFKRARTFTRISRADMDDRPALGFGLGSSGSRRDTLGVLVMSVQDSSPASRAGLEEGNRVAAINGVNLRVAREDADDPGVGRAKAQRLMREVSQLKPNDNVTLRVYANGQWREVTLRVARAGDLPRSRGMTYFGGADTPFPAMPGMPAMPAMPPMPPMPRGEWRSMRNEFPIELGPEFNERMQDVRMKLDQLRPELERVRPEMERVRPELERIGREMPRMMEKIRIPEVRLLMQGSGVTI